MFCCFVQSSQFCNHADLYNHVLGNLLVLHPLGTISAGFLSVLTSCQLIRGFELLWFIWFCINCLKIPFPFIQWKITIVTLQPSIAVMLKLFNKFYIILARIAIITAATRSNVRIEVFFLDRHDLLDMKCCILDEVCLITQHMHLHFLWLPLHPQIN